MKNTYIYILFALSLLCSCIQLEPEQPTPEGPEPTGKVMVNFQVAVPGDGVSTKAMGNVPAIDNIYVAVFGGSGFYNEWVKATIDNVTEANYDGTSGTVYNVSVALTMSDSRLRLHFIANCPERFKANPPITGISAQDLEEVVMGKVRSTFTDSFNDSYWQKVILPNGVKAKMVDVVDPETGNISEEYATDNDGNYIASDATINQFPNPIPLVRNFARIYLRNLTQDVTIFKYALIKAPAEGVVAPILEEAFASDVDGNYVPNVDTHSGKIYYEGFLRNYQNYPLLSDDENVTKVTDPPFNYGGYSPDNIAYGTYPDPNDSEKDPNLPTDAEMFTWDDTIDNDTGLQVPMFMYERGLPTTDHPATRVLIKAQKQGETVKYYALDIVDAEGNFIPILRNQTYTVKLIGIEAGAGEATIDGAAGSGSAAVSGDPATQYVTEINDGSSSISTSYAEMLYVKPGTYYVYYRYVPSYAEISGHAGVEDNSASSVTYQVGTKNESTGAFTPIAANEATNSVFLIQNGNYAITQDAGPFVRHGSDFTNDPDIVAATPEKWGRLTYQTISTGYVDNDGYFTTTRNAAIRIIGTYEGHVIFRDVLVKISPRKLMYVECNPKYVQEIAGESEAIRVRIPTDLPRSVFPLQFKIEAEKGTITPNGDVLPVETGQSIVPGVTGPSYCFIKNLTREQYIALGTVTVDGETWKYFDCNFRTTKATSASAVYVYNHYFDDNHDNDEFKNYTQRLFTGTSFRTTPLTRQSPVEFIFTMDNAHNGTTVWWDPAGNLDASLSTSNKVLPYAILVTLEGLQPEIDETSGRPRDRFVSGDAYDPDNTDNVAYYVLNIRGNESDPAEASLAAGTLHLVPTGEVNSTAAVTLSTLNLPDNPYLYKPTDRITATINGAQFTNVGFSGTYISSGLNRTASFHFTYATGLVVPITVTFEGLTLNGTDNRFTANGNNTYTFTPTNTNTTTYTFNVKTTSRFSPVKVTLSHEDYATVTTTLNRSAITVNTTSANYSNNNKSYTTDEGIVVAFSNTNPTFNDDYTIAPNNTDITVTAPSGSHVTKVVINYTSNTYRAKSVSVSSGTYSYSSPNGTWTAGNNSTTSVTLRTSKQTGWGANDTRIASIEITCVDD